jgi:hypothetical protein
MTTPQTAQRLSRRASEPSFVLPTSKDQLELRDSFLLGRPPGSLDKRPLSGTEFLLHPRNKRTGGDAITPGSIRETTSLSGVRHSIHLDRTSTDVTDVCSANRLPSTKMVHAAQTAEEEKATVEEAEKAVKEEEQFQDTAQRADAKSDAKLDAKAATLARANAFYDFFWRRTTVMVRISGDPSLDRPRLSHMRPSSGYISLESQPAVRSEKERIKHHATFAPVDDSFDEPATSSDVFEKLAPLLCELGLASGHTACIVAEGYSGSGKSHTLYTSTNSLLDNINEHVLPYADPEYQVTFEAVQSSGTQVESLEVEVPHGVALEKISSAPKDLNLGPMFSRSRPHYVVRDSKAFRLLLATMVEWRTERPTHNNRHASRTHLAVMIYITRAAKTSTLCVIDMAGHEQTDSVVWASKDTFAINRSRLEINKVFKAHIEGKTSEAHGTAVCIHNCSCVSILITTS